MIRIAAGDPLGFTQDDVALNGWAIETRVYAEDPYRGFLPSIGRLVRYRPPTPTDGGEVTVRIDDGVVEGGEVSVHYDPMIAKLITHAPTRIAAADAQVAALDAFRIDGIGHNIDFLSAIMQHDRFREGALTTGFIAEEYPDGFIGAPPSDDLIRKLAAIAAILDVDRAMRAASIDGQLNGPPVLSSNRSVRIAGQTIVLAATPMPSGHFVITNDARDDAHEVAVDWTPGEPLLHARFGVVPLTVGVERRLSDWRLTTRGASHIVTTHTWRVAELTHHMIEKLPPDMSRFLLAPMPGLLTRLHVAQGETVIAGQPLATVEAMKMENILRAERGGTVKAVNYAEGDSLAVDAAILEFD